MPETVNASDHVLLHDDVLVLTLQVRSTKTLQHNEHVLEILVSKTSCAPLCTVTLLHDHIRDFPVLGDAFLFQPILYRDLLSFLKDSVATIGLNPQDVGLHSLRGIGLCFSSFH